MCEAVGDFFLYIGNKINLINRPAMPYSLTGVGHNGFEKADLHIHTKCSDGIFTPEEIVAKAANCGLKAISITDHDSVLGIDKAIMVANEVVETADVNGHAGLNVFLSTINVLISKWEH